MAYPTGNGDKRARRRPRARLGFTLIELLVVMAIVATLLSLATPRYFRHTTRAEEVVLKHNLRGMREALDQYRQDRAKGPEALDDLVRDRYLREIPLDPITGRHDTWATQGEAAQGIRDVRSGSQKTSSEGSPYAQW
ncbi:type II secretion system protein [Pandoraea sp.]|uniref:type II secretion system protein n=1 Tax=Pandoraea sp. TaxID=1883445 RepID=UPI001207B332|nr:type II secretion system protein [Pandoraea sp.]TAL53575.1 MAG: type II secretion system protein [Pandoraea sp.]TAM14882.1 MAG: type II secretion system protein [Pandoraea sp.]